MPVDATDVQFANALADEARTLARRSFRRRVAVDLKADATPVTAVDRAIEQRLRDRIARQRPADGVLGEEQGRDGVDRSRVWIVDPIDGTKSFITGSPLFGSLVGLVQDGEPVLGVIEMPALGERFVGAPGRTTLAGRACRASDCTDLSRASCSTTEPGSLGVLEVALDRTVALRRFSADCYAYAQLALGCIDLVVETGLKPYDFLPLVPVVRGAGGVISDWNGEPLRIESAGQVLAAATPELHDRALALIASRGDARP